MWAHFSKVDMPDLTVPHKPTHWPPDKVLSIELRRQGGGAATKRLAKAKKEPFPTHGSETECNDWWARYQGRPGNRAKMAAAIMATHYERGLKQLDKMMKQLEQLQIRVESQEKETASFRWQIQNQEEKNKELRASLEVSRTSKQHLKDKMRSKDEQIESLQQKLCEKIMENHSLEVVKSKESRDYSKYSLNHLPVNREYLNDLPDLQENHSNHEFWKKIWEFFITGVQLQHIVLLVKAKCPREAWRKLKDLRETDLCLADFSNPVSEKEQLQKFRECISTALGSGLTQYDVYLSRRQRYGESFKDYIEDKFKLYCAYGAGDEEPDKNNLQFLQNVMKNAAQKYCDLKIHRFTTYIEMMNSVAILDNVQLTKKWKNRCENCGISGHVWKNCRRPGGGDEVPLGTCYTCGMPGHHSQHCGEL